MEIPTISLDYIENYRLSPLTNIYRLYIHIETEYN